jgi:glycosyltransferase involved in cell wall biosynthesis
MENKLVSIITPCYNTGNLIYRLLDSVLMQDYPSIEMIVVDDGSTDNSKEVIEDYIPKFEEKGYALRCIVQENSGQSVAINNALKLVNGEYLVWPDSDDYYSTAQAISRMVQVLENSNDDVTAVRCLYEFVDEHSLCVVDKIAYTAEEKELFEDCLYAKPSFWFSAGSCMARVSAVDERIKDRNIYTQKDAGQNWQLMLPLFYKKKCITINEYHYKVLQRSSSHSRGQYKTFEQLIRMYDAFCNTIVETLKSMYFMAADEMDSCIKNIECKYILLKYEQCLVNNKKDDAKMLEKALMEKTGFRIPVKLKIRYYLLPFYLCARRMFRR